MPIGKPEEDAGGRTTLLCVQEGEEAQVGTCPSAFPVFGNRLFSVTNSGGDEE